MWAAKEIALALRAASNKGFDRGASEMDDKAFFAGFSAGIEASAKVADTAEATHHKYSDSYEEGMRDMADQMAQAIRRLKPEGNK